jgi:hypothetical protein
MSQLCTCTNPDTYLDSAGSDTLIQVCVTCSREVPDRIGQLNRLFFDWLLRRTDRSEDLLDHVRHHGLQESLLHHCHDALLDDMPSDVAEARLARFDMLLLAAGCPTLLEWRAHQLNAIRADEDFDCYARVSLEF